MNSRISACGTGEAPTLRVVWAAAKPKPSAAIAVRVRKRLVIVFLLVSEKVLSAPVEPARCGFSEQLGELHHHDEDDDGGQHDVALKPLVTVGDGDVAESAAADRSGHRRVADDADCGGGGSADECGKCFGKINPGHDLPRACSHGGHGLYYGVIDLLECGFDQAGDERNRSHNEWNGSRSSADGRSDEPAGERDDRHKQDDEGNTTGYVHYRGQDRVSNA